MYVLWILVRIFYLFVDILSIITPRNSHAYTLPYLKLRNYTYSLYDFYNLKRFIRFNFLYIVYFICFKNMYNMRIVICFIIINIQYAVTNLTPQKCILIKKVVTCQPNSRHEYNISYMMMVSEQQGEV